MRASRRLVCDDANGVGAANGSEVLPKRVDQGMSEAEAEAMLEGLAIRVEPLSQALALAAARLRRQTRLLGPSLGDRCCLALAPAHDAFVVTAYRPCKQLKGFRFAFLR